jgi:hypothetical protein
VLFRSLDYIEDLRKATNRLESLVNGFNLLTDVTPQQYETYYKNNLKVHAAIIENLLEQKL